MKLITSALVGGALVFSSIVFAGVTVELHRDLAPVVIGGEEVGVRVNTQRLIELDNGHSQLVVRVSKLIPKQSKFEKYYSYPVVLTFSASDAALYVSPAETIRSKEQAERFKTNPTMKVTDSSGKPFAVHQGVLMPGSGLVRDYEEELEDYNKEHGFAVSAGGELAQAPKINSVAAEETKTSQAMDMIQYWHDKASAKEKQQFADWAFQNRKTISTELTSGNKPLEMLGYWYKEATDKERATILGWLIEQE